MQVVHVFFLGVIVTAMLGCLDKHRPLVPDTSPDVAVGIVNASPDNALLAVGGTLQIGVQLFTLTGAPLVNADSIAYRMDNAADTARVRVSVTGLTTALATTAAPAPVDIVVFNSGTFNADQILVMVTPTAVSGLTLSIQPSAGDSAKQASGTAKTITPVLRNPTTGQSVTGVALQYVVLPQDILRVGVYTGSVPIRRAGVSGNLTFVHQAYSPAAALNQILPYVAEGTAWIYAKMNVYGTILQDSVLYTFSYPYTGTVAVTKSNLAVRTAINSGAAAAVAVTPSMTLAPGATVTFTNGVGATDPMGVAFSFDNPIAAVATVPPTTVGGTSGNVTILTGGQSAKRRFLSSGTYHWTWVSNGGPAPWAGQTATGAIVIK